MVGNERRDVVVVGASEIDSTKTKKKRHKSVNVRHKGRRTQHRNGPGWANDRYIDKKKAGRLS
jgi:hypothetical protein